MAENELQLPAVQVACATPVKPDVLVAIDGVEPLVAEGKLNEQLPCVNTEALHEADEDEPAFGTEQRATPLTIW